MRTGRRDAGFTLMEVMVAIAILAMVSTLIWTAFAQTSRAKKVVEASNDRYHQAMIAMRRICSDLSMAYITQNINQQAITTESVFIGHNDDPDTLDFMAFAHRRRLKDVKESDQCELGYRLVEDPEDRDRRNLVRREAFQVDDEPEKGGRTQILLEDALEFDLEYYDPAMDQWEKEWDTTQVTGHPNRLPTQIRVKLVIRGSRKDEELTFVTQTPIGMTEPVFYTGA
jgi:general secretion pathway protein J